MQKTRLCMDARMLADFGTGVTAYARALRGAHLTINPDALLLTDQSDSFAGGRWQRRARALLPLGGAAKELTGHRAGELRGRDLFRLGQVWFDIHDRVMPVRVSGPPGIMHWSYPLPLRITGWRNIYTIHDAIPLSAPTLSPINPRRHRRLLAAVIGEAKTSGAIATVSDAAAEEIVAATGCPRDLIVNCSQSVAPVDDPAVTLPSGLQEKAYFLVCGSVEPRKNIAAIIAAHVQSGTRLPLVIAGPDEADGAIMLSVARDRLVMRLPAQTNAAMSALLGRARALLMPSLAEGFGRPVVEAMALGTPVITSMTGALAEVAGGAAILVDPRDITSMAGAIRRLADDDALAAAMAAEGLVNARRFTPARFEAQLWDLYQQFHCRLGPSALSIADGR